MKNGNWYGYNIVLAKNQHSDRGNISIRKWCEENHKSLVEIYEDVQTGRNTERSNYIVLKESVLKEGDNLILPEYNCLGKASETKGELEYFKEKGVRIIFLDMPTTQIDLSTLSDDMAKLLLECISNMLISFYDCIARSELQRRRKSQREGYKNLKEKGEWDKLGRPRKMSKDEFEKAYQAVVNGELRTTELMKQLGITENTYYRYVKEYRSAHNEKLEDY